VCEGAFRLLGRFEIISPGPSIRRLHDYHVAAIAAFGEEPAGGGVRFDGGDYLLSSGSADM
jgi:hypothetical protein